MRFIEESEMSEVLPEDLVELRSEVEVLEREGEVGANSEPNSAKYGWASAWLAVIRLFGSKCNIFYEKKLMNENFSVSFFLTSSRSLASVPISGNLSLTFWGRL